MRKTVLQVALLGAVAIALAGCGGGGGGSASSPTPVVVPSFEAQFGVGFNTDFFASANSQPVVPVAGDIIALSLTTQPVAFQ